MTPQQIDTILVRLDALADDVGEVKEEVKKTNGRVRSIELWKARVEGAQAAYSWVTPAVVGIGCSFATFALTRLFG